MKGKPAKFSPHKSINSFLAVNSWKQLDFAILCLTCSWIDRWANLSHYIIRFHLMYEAVCTRKKTIIMSVVNEIFYVTVICNTIALSLIATIQVTISISSYETCIPKILLRNIHVNVTKLISRRNICTEGSYWRNKIDLICSSQSKGN